VPFWVGGCGEERMKRQAPYDLEGRGKWPSPDDIPAMNVSLWNCAFDVAIDATKTATYLYIYMDWKGVWI